MEKPVPYQAYLIRLWPTRRRGVADYRVTLESVATGQRQTFRDLDGLVAFLQAQREEGQSPECREEHSNQGISQSSPQPSKGGQP